ncbi:chromosome segregation protein Spc25-domain-containing protein [Chytridium lagenaria]|nr:chromosome segregation protein Spc25-domain-containing protein [Chytridium lagenaria]
MSDEYAAVVHDYDALRRDCAAFLETYDAWVAQKKENILMVKNSYQHKSAEQKEKYLQLKSELDHLQNHMSGLKKAEEREMMETHEMEKTISELSLKHGNQMMLKDKLEQETYELREQIQSRRKTLEAIIAQREEVERKSKPEAAFFESKLAMKILTLKDNLLRFSFTLINSKDWDEEYFFIVDVSNEIYKVVKCQPEIKELDELVGKLNRTRDFYTFLKEVRKAFQNSNGKA